MGKSFDGYGEDFWTYLSESCNTEISNSDVMLMLGRIMSYGYQGTISNGWVSQIEEGAKGIAETYATQLLIWEVIVGERDAGFEHVVPEGGFNETTHAVMECVGDAHPLNQGDSGLITTYYKNIVDSMKAHMAIPSFAARSTDELKEADPIKLEWSDNAYSVTSTDNNNVLSKFTSFTAVDKDENTVEDIEFEVRGNELTITASSAAAVAALTNTVTVTATKTEKRTEVLTWSDGFKSGDQDSVTYNVTTGIKDAVNVNLVDDKISAYFKLKVSLGSLTINKTSEEKKAQTFYFEIKDSKGNVVVDSQKVTTDANGNGSVTVNNLAPDTYTVTEKNIPTNMYPEVSSKNVQVDAGKTGTVSFTNKLKGNLKIYKTSDEAGTFCFEIKDSNGTVVASASVPIDENGGSNSVTVNNLKPDTYTVTETNIPTYMYSEGGESKTAEVKGGGDL